MGLRMELLLIYKDTFWKIWLRLAYLSYLIDCLAEKIFDLLLKLNLYWLAGVVRTFGSGNMSPITNAAAYADVLTQEREEILDEEHNPALWRCYYGAALFREVWVCYFETIFCGRRPPTVSPLSDEEVQSLLENLKDS
jgi:hypothetical protein